MPPTLPQPNAPTTSYQTSTRSLFVPVLITIIVVAVILGVAWRARLISFGSLNQATTIQTPATSDQTNTSSASSTPFLASGIYSLVGRGGGQTANYSGTLTIKWRENTPDIFDLVWNITNGQVQYGVGILTKNILSVSYYQPSDDGVTDVGVGSYELVDPTHLNGEWTSVLGGLAGV